MNNFFECKISYEKLNENGVTKKVTEKYLVDGLSFTEVEARIVKEMQPYIGGEFQVAAIVRYPLTETFFNENGDKYYKAKLVFITLDERTGAEKKTKFNVLSQASDIQQAKDVIVEGMKGTMADYEILEVKETMIMDVFRFETEK